MLRAEQEDPVRGGGTHETGLQDTDEMFTWDLELTYAQHILFNQ